MASFLSTKAVPAAERLIFALDVPSTDDAIRLIAALGENVSLLQARARELMDRLTDQGKKVMVDLKFFDVPETVRRAVRQLA